MRSRHFDRLGLACLTGMDRHIWSGHAPLEVERSWKVVRGWFDSASTQFSQFRRTRLGCGPALVSADARLRIAGRLWNQVDRRIMVSVVVAFAAVAFVRAQVWRADRTIWAEAATARRAATTGLTRALQALFNVR
jgi:hypothetical protein